jgi:hypothetical protein
MPAGDERAEILLAEIRDLLVKERMEKLKREAAPKPLVEYTVLFATSLAILLQLAEIGVGDISLKITLYLVAIAIPCLAHVIERQIRGEDPLNNASSITILATVIGIVFPAISITTLVWHLSSIAGLVFLVLSAAALFYGLAVYESKNKEGRSEKAAAEAEKTINPTD